MNFDAKTVISQNQRKGDALEYRVRSAFSAIIMTAYGAAIPPFKLICINETRSFNGSYNQRTKTISLYNLIRPARHVIVTGIHELAHHCEFSLYGKTGHKQTFYMVYIDLMNAALKMGMFTYQEVCGISDSTSIRQIERYNHGPLSQEPEPSHHYKAGKLLTYAFRSYQARDVLQNHGYHYNTKAKAWEKEIAAAAKDDEYTFLMSLPGNIQAVFTNDFLDLTVHMAVMVYGRTYEIRELLGDNGFRFYSNLIGLNCPGWYKQIRSTELEECSRFAKMLGQHKGVHVLIQ